MMTKSGLTFFKVYLQMCVRFLFYIQIWGITASVHHHNTSLRSFSSTSNPVGMLMSSIVIAASVLAFL